MYYVRIMHGEDHQYRKECVLTSLSEIVAEKAFRRLSRAMYSGEIDDVICVEIEYIEGGKA